MEVDTIQKQALMVNPPDASFNPDAPAETGEQYLQKVMYERKKCPAVVVATKPKTAPERKQLTGTGALPENDVQNLAPQALIPTREWETMQNRKFAELRDTITSYRNGTKYQENLERTHVFLNFENRKQLHEYCANNQPFVRILLSIPQRNLEQLLEYLLEWLQSEQQEVPPVKDGGKDKACRKDWIKQWIYAIMACLITPLEPNIHSVMRDIAKACIASRNALGSEEEAKVLPLNLLICIISKNFNQLDLGDNIAE